ncbi:MAG: T9SS type A sorting domain-containing protein [Bacteroidetes bacterium]|nr:T9SS type A sorting domain-containing protein [Bacteroidota bacterium]
MKNKFPLLFLLFFNFLIAKSQIITGLNISSLGWTPVYCVTSDSMGNYYAIGSFHSSVSFDSAGVSKTLTSNASEALFIVKFDCKNNFNWAITIDNTARWTLMPSIKYKFGHLYATTSFVGSTTIHSSDGSTMSKTCSGSLGGLLLKINDNGVLAWVNLAESTTDRLEFHDVNVSKAGDIYVAGMYFGSANIYGQNFTSMTTTSSSGSEDAMYMKFNSQGETKWVKEGKSSGDDISGFIALDNNDNLYFSHQVGCCGANTVTFDSYSFVNGTNWGTAYTKIDTGTGAIDWFTSIPGEAIVNGGIVTDDYGFLYVIGHYTGTKKIYSADKTKSFSVTSNGQWDTYVAKFSSTGDLIWVKSFGGTGNDYGNRCLYKKGKIYMTLTYSSNFIINNGTSISLTNSGGSDDAVLIFDTSGVLTKVYSVTGSNSSRALAIDLTTSGKLILAGSYSGTINSGNTSITNTTGNDNGYIYVFDNAMNPDFIQNKENLICNGDSIHLISGIKTGYCSWSPGDLLNDSMSSEPTTKSTTNTKYVLKYTTTEGCIYYDTAYVNYKNCSNGFERLPTNISNANVYPNPSSGTFSISFETHNSGIHTISIKNMLGQDLLSKTAWLNTGLSNQKIDINHFCTGIYILTISNERGLTSLQLIKE